MQTSPLESLDHDALDDRLTRFVKESSAALYARVAQRLTARVHWRIKRFPEKRLDTDSYRAGWNDGFLDSTEFAEMARAWREALDEAEKRVVSGEIPA